MRRPGPGETAEEAKNLAQAAVNPLTTTMTVPVQFDSATDDYLGLEENGLGLSYIGVNVDGPKLYGFLVNHIYSVEGQVGDTYSNTFLQPFFDYTTDGALTIDFNLNQTTTGRRINGQSHSP